jgi:hypothetical protein
MAQVLLTDAKFEYRYARQIFKERESWAREHCPSFMQMDIVDVSDYTYEYDQIATYEFGDEKDAFWFTTAWQS